MKLCILNRGAPGSGKSFRARKYAEEHPGTIIFSTDDFFVGRNGEYVFKVEKLGTAHRWNYERFEWAVLRGAGPIIVDNTNCSISEMRPYCKHAVSCGYEVVIWEPSTLLAFDVDELVKRNQHGVSREAIERMLRRYQFGVTVEKVLATGGC